MPRTRGTSRLEGVFRGVRVTTGAILASAGLFALHGAVSTLASHDYVGAILYSSSGLFLVASGTALFRPEVAE